MTKANILPENDLYMWFNTTIYYFHVPLFFICSGYLYQKYSKVNSVGSWCKKAVIPKTEKIIYSDNEVQDVFWADLIGPDVKKAHKQICG